MLTKKKLKAEIARLEKDFLTFKMNVQLKFKELEEGTQEPEPSTPEPQPKEKVIEKHIEDQNKN